MLKNENIKTKEINRFTSCDSCEFYEKINVCINCKKSSMIGFCSKIGSRTPYNGKLCALFRGVEKKETLLNMCGCY